MGKFVMAKDPSIKSSADSGVLTITLNRPDKLNAMRRQDFERLAELIQGFAEDDTQKVLILTGNGRGFCAGEDLHEFLEPGETDLEKVRTRVNCLQRITEVLLALDKPTIAAVNGPAVGFGFEVTLACDLRIASEDAYFWFSEVKRGLLPTNGAFFLLPRLIGLSHTARMMLTAEKVPAQQALEFGIISAITTPEELIQKAQTLALGMLDNSTSATAMIKEILRQSFDRPINEIMEMEVQGTLKLAAQGEVLKGAQAFALSSKL
jgi:enoyl-CoA hydratase/carnithine racemase